MGNTTLSKIVGIGDIVIQMSVDCTMTLHDVRYILDMHLNLMAVSILDREGYEHRFGDGKWKLTRDSLLVPRRKLCYTLYKTRESV